MYLHQLLLESNAADAHLFIVFNTSYFNNNKDDNYIENPFKKAQLQALFQLDKKVSQQVKVYEMDVKNEEAVNLMFDQVATHVRREKARKKKQSVAQKAENVKNKNAK